MGSLVECARRLLLCEGDPHLRLVVLDVLAADVDDNPVDPAVESERRVIVRRHRRSGVGADGGNVWEWTSEWYGDSRAGDSCCEAGSYDSGQPQFKVPRKVIKGGSFLCADNYCLRYRPAARRPQMIDTGMSHIGFRCVKRASE